MLKSPSRRTATCRAILVVFAASAAPAAAGDEAGEQYRCMGFQKTSDCDAKGKKEGKKKCDEEIEAGESGYCVCKNSRGLFKQIRGEDCDHAPFSCKNTCARYWKLNLTFGFNGISTPTTLNLKVELEKQMDITKVRRIHVQGVSANRTVHRASERKACRRYYTDFLVTITM